MQGLYLSDMPDVLDKNPKIGVARKIQAQVKTLCDEGLHCENVCLKKRSSAIWDRIRRRLALFGDGLEWRVDDKIKEADYLYIRRPWVISWSFLLFLKRVKKVNPHCHIIMELPTYPYDMEFVKDWYNIPMLWQDRFFRRWVHKYLDRIATLTEDDVVFGVPTLKIQNGVDLTAYRIKKQNTENVLNIGCVATFSYWHGVDRFLKGLAEYKQLPGEKRKVHLYLAGEGPHLPELKKIVADHGLQDIVTFCGQLDITQLYEQIYDRCDIGIEGLGTFRENPPGVISSSLKSKEYMAVGLPMIYVERLDVLEREPADFCLRVPSNEEPVDVTSVIDFYEGLLKKETKEQLSERVRAYAERNVGWDKTFSNVTAWLKQQSKEMP